MRNLPSLEKKCVSSSRYAAWRKRKFERREIKNSAHSSRESRLDRLIGGEWKEKKRRKKKVKRGKGRSQVSRLIIHQIYMIGFDSGPSQMGFGGKKYGCSEESTNVWEYYWSPPGFTPQLTTGYFAISGPQIRRSTFWTEVLYICHQFEALKSSNAGWSGSIMLLPNAYVSHYVHDTGTQMGFSPFFI